MLIAQTNYQASQIQPSNTTTVNKVDNITMYVSSTSILVCSFFLIYKLFQINKTKKDKKIDSQIPKIDSQIPKIDSQIPKIDSQNEKIEQLLRQVETQKMNALNRYNNDIDRLIEQVKVMSNYFECSTKENFLKELEETNLAGFGKKEKLEEFNKYKLQPILEKQTTEFQKELKKLGEQFYYIEKNLENNFSQILLNLKNNCQRLRISEPDFNFYKLEVDEKQSIHKILSSTTKSVKVDHLGGYVAVSCAALLGFFPSDALADTTTDAAAHGVGHAAGHGVGHAAGHGVGHAVGHGVGHAVGHGVGHAVGHGVGHAVGLAIPILNVALISFSLYRLGKFFFDDSEVKKQFREYTLNEISKYYRIIRDGKGSDIGLDGQLQYIKNEFCKSQQELFDKSLQPTLESVIARLENGHL
ncbi:hypothetical protein H6G41_30550 [Tolypothrix sp. FACHB-123]|uniref:hypothetical protein n=1 Tax=Tolypothrix sp. FACHB-123 TaxID=2692868 RepID=UPI001687C115|nr:hypothetical protein [Tolypothrix sp. FACHB-123]MBD2358888.1 hypothetical protein [Tolypothrix sp. FACHB-123]